MNTPMIITNGTNGRILDTPSLSILVDSFATLTNPTQDNMDFLRNLSTAINDSIIRTQERLNSVNDSDKQTKEDKEDLSELVLNEQEQIKQKQLNSPTLDDPKLSQLTNVVFTPNPLAYVGDNYVTKLNNEQENVHKFPSKIAQYADNTSETMDDDTSTSDDSSNRMELRSGLKRTSSSSTFENKLPTKRGRKPLNQNINKNNTTQSIQKKLTKKERLLREAKNPVCFGNKVVEKGTEEYDKRRKNNNEAVKLCRQKQAENQKKREEAMKNLEDDNKRLTQKVQKLTQELNCLKDVIYSMHPNKKLPANINELINRVEHN